MKRSATIQPAKWSLAAVAVLGVLLISPVRADDAAPVCDSPIDLLRLANPLPHVSKRLSAGQPITIVAIGSSSTQGAGASSPAASYPSRLAVELQARFPRNRITVLNRGVGGEEVRDMLKRFDRAVIAEKPDLVLWQLGTNSVIRDHPLSDHGAAIREGLNKIKTTGADVVLIDPQFAPKVIAKPEAEKMVGLIALTAKTENVDLYHRFDLMRRWRNVDKIAFEKFVSPDGLHMNDWSYACLAKGLGYAIAEAATRPVAAASAAPAR
ncbi:MAG TPA: GDSL-type esterase/lipase family protein [Pseudolabrys sp.]|nr:GDSL-type esterase/lipase family protein [Pseudolabrys sp.]